MHLLPQSLSCAGAWVYVKILSLDLEKIIEIEIRLNSFYLSEQIACSSGIAYVYTGYTFAQVSNMLAVVAF